MTSRLRHPVEFLDLSDSEPDDFPSSALDVTPVNHRDSFSSPDYAEVTTPVNDRDSFLSSTPRNLITADREVTTPGNDRDSFSSPTPRNLITADREVTTPGNERDTFSPSTSQNYSASDYEDSRTISTSHISASSPSGPTEETFMALIRETNMLVKSFGSRLIELERKVEEIRDREPMGMSDQRKEKKATVTDEIRVSMYEHCYISL